ncbi:MAG: vitamin K epoxide reductase [Anaerolineae bacterium]|nr:vitamin K epoxide reductase [Anaerolineae bacterium]
MKKLPLLFVILLIVACLAIQPTAAAQSADEPVVRAILFYTPTCPACHRVNDEVLEPMMDDYGDRLQIVRINTHEPSGYELYLATVERHQIPRERQGVPTLVVGEVVLVGGREIPEQFPSLVEEELAAGGIGWPDVLGLTQAVSEIQSPPSDPVGFALAGVVLVGMVVALGYAAWRVGTARRRLFQLLQLDRNPLTYAKTRAIPILGLVGLGIATYLAYVEITHVEALCGPIGECNIVQTSSYALILGIPVAVLGVLHYLAIGALWMGQRYQGGRWGNQTTLGLLGLTIFGALFSIYLTCLELFVVRAICSWCLGSAVATTILMLLVVLPVTGSPSSKK